jgi:hypothetical protein
MIDLFGFRLVSGNESNRPALGVEAPTAHPAFST